MRQNSRDWREEEKRLKDRKEYRGKEKKSEGNRGKDT
jgi:hypothetical protein